MILCDFSKTAYSVVHAFENDIRKATCKEDIEGIIRHAMINSFTSVKTKFAYEFGKELVVCTDGQENFRYKIFPNYKANRKAKRKESDLPWHMIFDVINTIHQEAIEFWPWKIVGIPEAEADDVMAVLIEDVANKRTTVVGVLEEELTEPVLMDTGDNDMFQLHKYPNVKQYSTRMKKLISPDVPIDEFVRDLIIHGDPGDGVPNILTHEDYFVNKIRQTTMSAKRKAPFLEIENILEYKDDPEIARRIRQNYQLVCFDSMDIDIRQKILESYNNARVNKKMAMLGYLNKKKCVNLVSMIGNM